MLSRIEPILNKHFASEKVYLHAHVAMDPMMTSFPKWLTGSGCVQTKFFKFIFKQAVVLTAKARVCLVIYHLAFVIQAEAWFRFIARFQRTTL